jgi:hypothetical protein
MTSVAWWWPSRRCLRNTPKKRFFLPLVAIVGLAAYEEFQDFVYLPLVVSCASFVVFWNFPFIVYGAATRPLYYEDLFIDTSRLPTHDVDERVKQKFQTILVWVLIVTNTVLVGALSDYWLYKTKDAPSYTEVMGITGGIIKIFQVINNTVGRLMLKVFRRFIVKANARSLRIEVTEIQKIVRLKRVQSALWRDLGGQGSDLEHNATSKPRL